MCVCVCVCVCVSCSLQCPLHFTLVALFWTLLTFRSISHLFSLLTHTHTHTHTLTQTLRHTFSLFPLLQTFFSDYTPINSHTHTHTHTHNHSLTLTHTHRRSLKTMSRKC